MITKTERNKIEGKPPLCRVPTCKAKGERRYLSNSPNADDKTGLWLLVEIRKAKKAQLDVERSGAGRV